MLAAVFRCKHCVTLKKQFFIYEKAEHQGQESEYLVMSEYLTPNSGCDTFALTNSGKGGYFLSSSPQNTLNAYIFGFYLSTAYCDVGGACREMGYSVRPVSG
jgi:hypothetical protein